MSHIVVFGRTEARASNEAVLWSDDLAGEESRELWMGIGEVRD